MTERRRSDAKALFEKESRKLVALLDDAPAEAIAEARSLPDEPLWRNLRGMVLVDGGRAASDQSAVAEGAKLFADAYARDQHPGTAYNLANAFSALARFDAYDGPAWYLRTAAQRSDSRALFATAAEGLRDRDPLLASRALTNLGNALDVSHRWIEAYEAYRSALDIFPNNGVASGCAAQVLFRIASLELVGHEPHMLFLARRLAHHAQENADTVRSLAGPAVVAEFATLPSEPGAYNAAPPCTSAYEEWVSNNRLALTAAVEGLGHDEERWDDAHIHGVSEPVSSGASVPPIFAMFNVLKADYLVARELLFESISLDGASTETGLYFDTLDYATYGRKASLLTLAQRAALDLLDKLAVALNDYLVLGWSAERVHFHTVWRGPKAKGAQWNSAIESELNATNPPLVALLEIAVDLSGEPLDGATHKGFLHSQRSARNAATHRFVVLHDFGDFGLDRPRPTPAIEHHKIEEFERSALRTFQLVRAALLYFVEVVAFRERRLHDASSLSVPMLLVPHHEIRATKRKRTRSHQRPKPKKNLQ